LRLAAFIELALCHCFRGSLITERQERRTQFATQIHSSSALVLWVGLLTADKVVLDDVVPVLIVIASSKPDVFASQGQQFPKA
jgi:hypothetical protein